VGDVVFGAEAGHMLAGEIKTVRDECVRDSKATYYVLSEKLDNLLPADFRERYCLDPLDKVVGGYR